MLCAGVFVVWATNARKAMQTLANLITIIIIIKETGRFQRPEF